MLEPVGLCVVTLFTEPGDVFAECILGWDSSGTHLKHLLLVWLDLREMPKVLSQKKDKSPQYNLSI